jgi:hypothetical protein
VVRQAHHEGGNPPQLAQTLCVGDPRFREDDRGFLERALGHHLPAERASRMKRYDQAVAGGDRRRNARRRARQGDLIFIEREAIKPWAEFAGKALQPVKRAFFFEGLGIAFHCNGGTENTGAAAGRLLRANLVGG